MIQGMRLLRGLLAGLAGVAIAPALGQFIPGAGHLGHTAAQAQAVSTRSSLRQTLADFFNQDAEDRNRGQTGGSRGPGQRGGSPNENKICILNPGLGEELWNPQPLFMLQGNVERIAIQRIGEITPFWSAPVIPTEAGYVQVPFEGQPLQPGGRYAVLFYQRQPNQSLPVVLRLRFQVMAAGAERDQIATDLAQIQTDLAQQDAETMTGVKVAYLLENNLPADALQELFAAEAPTEALAALQTETIERICSQDLEPRTR